MRGMVEHVAVTVADIEWSLAFFQNVFGMQETRRKEDNGKLKQVWLDGGIQLVAAPKNSQVGKCHHLGMVADDFVAVREAMLAYDGVHHIAGKPEKWLQLPDGMVIELFQAKTGAIDKGLAVTLK